MRHLVGSAAVLAVLLAGCATSPSRFYADPTKPDDTSLCRVALDTSSDPSYRADVAQELLRRGLTVEACQTKINTQTAVVVGAALVGLTTAAIIACNNGSCPSGGGGGLRDKDCYGGRGDGPDWQYGPIYVGSYDPHRLDVDQDGWGCEASDLSYGA
jgi:hypothetical protein